MQLFNADCLDVLPTLEANSVDTIITDPPYALTNRTLDTARCLKCGWAGTQEAKFYTGPCPKCGEEVRREREYKGGGFMGKTWDTGAVAFSVELWTEALRVAKPGAILLAFGGSRTHHRLMCAIEDAGWEIRDCMMWLYGSGFPKSLDIGKAIDKANGSPLAFRAFARAYAAAVAASPLTHSDIDRHLGILSSSCYWAREDHRGGMPPRHHWEKVAALLDLPADLVSLYDEAEREVTGKGTSGKTAIWNEQGKMGAFNITAPATPLAAQWHGWGTALKPAWEPIIVAQKPLDGTYAANAERWGVAGMWIDGGRIPTSSEDAKAMERCNTPGSGRLHPREKMYSGPANGTGKLDTAQGRWPANLILDEESAAALDVMSGERKGSKPGTRYTTPRYTGNAYANGKVGGGQKEFGYGDTGGASRFFYCAKASRAERNYGLEGMEKKEGPETGRRHVPAPGRKTARGAPRENHHPTVKPLALMRYLCRLTKTPTGGVVLDMFAGSGTTGMAALLEGREFIGIEADTEHGYFEIMRRRIEAVQRDIEAEQSKPRQYALNEAAS